MDWNQLNVFKALTGFFLLVFIFIGGTLVGTKFGPTPSEDQSAHLPAATSKTSKPQVSSSENLKAEISKPRANQKASLKEPQEVAPTPKPDLIAKKNVTKEESASTPQAPKGNPYLNQSRKGYTVLIASVKNSLDAYKEAKSFKSKFGLDVFYYPQTLRGQTWYRIGVGAFSLKGTAQGLQKHIESSEMAKNTLIKKIP